MFLMKTCVRSARQPQRIYDTIHEPDGSTTRVFNAKETMLAQQKQEQIREAMKEKKNARKLVEQYAPTRELDVMAIVARNQLVEKQFTEGEHTKTIENINPVLSENSKILEESTKQRRTSREENLLGKLMEASNQ